MATSLLASTGCHACEVNSVQGFIIPFPLEVPSATLQMPLCEGHCYVQV